MSQFDVVSICNALVDMLIKVEDQDITDLQMTKGIMHLVDADRQREVLARFKDHETITELGGSCLNAIRSLSALGAKTTFAGMVGNDTYGHVIEQRMEQLDIHPNLMRVEGNEATGTCLILITPDGERTMNTNLGASRLFTPALIPKQALEKTKIFHFCGYQWDTDGQIETIERAIDHAKKHDVLISFDVADPFVIGRHRDAFLKVIADKADIVFANKDEAHMLYECTPEEAAAKIAATGAIAVIKKGAEGAVVGHKKELTQITPVPTKVVDTTAAGDMFAAGFLYGTIQKKNLETCGHMAATLASDVISRIGATVDDAAFARTKSL